nr:type II toxin-antitoxin system HicA family toxin [Campylobacter sp.]
MNEKRLEKEIEKLKNSKADVKFEILEKILFALEYESLVKGTSHRTFRKKGFDNITIPKHNPVKPIYVKFVIEAYEKKDKK